MTPDLHRFFQRATRPWAAIFQLLAALLAALMVAEPTSMSLTLSTVVTPRSASPESARPHRGSPGPATARAEAPSARQWPASRNCTWRFAAPGTAAYMI
jgi:hypothetical protein